MEAVQPTSLTCMHVDHILPIQQRKLIISGSASGICVGVLERSRFISTLYFATVMIHTKVVWPLQIVVSGGEWHR